LLPLFLFPPLFAQGKKLRLEIETERAAFFTLDGSDSLILTPLSTRADSSGIFIGAEPVITPFEIKVGGILHPATAVESLSIDIFYDTEEQPVRKAERLGDRDRLALVQPAQVAAGDYLKGNLVVLGGDALIDGEVGGDIVVFLGNCRLGAEAVVHGDVIVIGGEVFQKDGAVIYGLLSRESREEDHKKRRYYDEETRFGILGFSGAYNRVDGFNLQFFLRYTSFDGHSKLWGGGGHAFSRNRWLYDVGYSQKIFSENHFSFGASAYRQTWSEDARILGKGENSFATLLLRADLLDYTEREGLSAFVGQEYKKIHQLKISYALDRYKNLPKETDWSILRGPERFRTNFSTLPTDTLAKYQDDFNAEIATVTVVYSCDTRNDVKDPETGWYAVGEWELAGGEMGKDRDYSRMLLNLERIQPLWPRHTFVAHALFGGSIHRLPLQKLFFLGGIGTLRGFRHKQFYGDRVVLVNLEYHARLVDKMLVPTPALFFDWGKTSLRSADPEFWSGAPFKANLGLGAKFGAYLRFDLARGFGAGKNPVRFTFRFARTF
jgi:hypothetical protein